MKLNFLIEDNLKNEDSLKIEDDLKKLPDFFFFDDSHSTTDV